MSQMNYLHDIYYIYSNRDLTSSFAATNLDDAIKMIIPIVRCEIIEKTGRLPEITVVIPISYHFYVDKPAGYDYIYDCKRHWLFLFRAREITRLFDVNQSVSIARGTGDYKHIDKVNAILLNNYISKHSFKGFYDGEG